jgi:hypothetical protein
MDSNPSADKFLFDPFHLRPLASLNRRKIAALPSIKEGIVGSTGSELLTKPGLIRLIQSFGPLPGLEEVEPREYPQQLNRFLDEPTHPAHGTALRIAECYGRRLGALLASILLFGEGLTEPIDAWEACYLAYWRETTRDIYLGGGLANGKLGAITSQKAEEVLVESGISGRRVRTAPQPSFLPLLGAARSVPGKPRAAVVADFGSSRAKTGLAVYDQDGCISGLNTYPAIDIHELTAQEKTIELAEAMVEIINGIFRRAAEPASLSPQIICSVAAYVENGEPVKINRGPYTLLHQLSPNLRAYFEEKISQACGREISITFEHDGDIAGCALAGREPAALVMLGTGLGVGFIPPARDFHPISAVFHW